VHLGRRLLLGLILVLYLGLSLYQIDLPGLHYDEAFEAVPALQLLLGRPVTAFRNSGLVINGQIFPLMTQDYIGALNTYLSLPFIYFLGPAPVALRAMSILIGAVTLWLAYGFVRQLTGSSRAGLAAAVLLAVEPTFIFWNRQGIFVTAITATIGLAAALCWLRWYKNRSSSSLVLGAFLFGLGLYAKFLFIWLIAALIGAVGLLYLAGWLLSGRTRPLVRPVRLPARQYLAAILAFFLGCWPLIVYNLQTGGTFLSISQNAATSYYGVNNLAIGANLGERLYQLFILLCGSQFWFLGKSVSNYLSPLLFALTFMLVAGNIITTRIRLPAFAGPSPKEAGPALIALFPFLVIGLVIIASVGTVSALWVTHLALLSPWPAIAMTVGGWAVLSTSPGRTKKRWAPALIWCGWALLVVTQLVSTVRYHSALTKSGGLSSHSDTIYELSAWLNDHRAGPVVAMDWGLAAPVTYLTGGRVMPTEIFGYTWQPGPELNRQLERFIALPDTLYLWRSPDEIIFDRSSEFKALYRPLGLEETIEAAFYEKSGRPILGVTRLVRCGLEGINPPDPSPLCP
jgi:4-amino-4-deoxy-L-arabinose transferase-like glycosyltransferase